MSDGEGEDYNEDYYDDGGEDYYDDGGAEEEHHMELEAPQSLMKKQSSVATHKNIEFVQKNIVISRIEQSIDAVQNDQGISSGRALFLLRTCGYNVQDTQNIPHKIMDDIYFSETKLCTESKNKLTCLKCEKELGDSIFNLECNHRYCKPCTEQYLTDELGSQNENRICSKCPLSECKERFGYKDIQKLVSEQHYKEYQTFLENDAYKLANYIVKCPQKDCTIVVIQLDQLSLKAVPKTIRCQCRTLFCSSCGSNAHEPLKCGTVSILSLLEKQATNLKNLKEKEEYYTSSESSSKYNFSSFSTDWCPNDCRRLLETMKDDPKKKKCPFCEGIFCGDCKKLVPCPCHKEESKEDMQEEDVKKQEKEEQSKNRPPLPTVVKYLYQKLEIFQNCKDELIFVKVAKRKIATYLQNLLKNAADKGDLENEVNFVNSALDIYEDVLLFIGHSNIFLSIGAESKGDLLKFQVDQVKEQYNQIKELFKDYDNRFKTLKIAEIKSVNFQKFKEIVITVEQKLTKLYTSCLADFSGITSKDKEIEDMIRFYQEDSPEALVKVKREQDRRDQESKMKNSFMGGMGGFDMRAGGRMGGGHHGMPGDYGRGGHGGHNPRRGGQEQYQNRYQPDSDDDDDDDDDGYAHRMHFNPQQMMQQLLKPSPEQLLQNFLNVVRRKEPEFYDKVKVAKTVQEAKQILEEEKKKVEPIYNSENILVVLLKGVDIHSRSYQINLQEENIKDNKILSFLVGAHTEIFAAHEKKHEQITKVTQWPASFFNYYEFLLMKEFEKARNVKSKVGSICHHCQKDLYPENDPDFSTTIHSQLKTITDTDVIILNGCKHPVHVGCYKAKVTPQITYKCPCSVEYLRPFASNFVGILKDKNDYKYVELEYTLYEFKLGNKEIKNGKISGFLTPYDQKSVLIYQNLIEAHNRGLTFEIIEEENAEPKFGFRIHHDLQQPPRFSVLIRNNDELLYLLKNQLEQYNIKPLF